MKNEKQTTAKYAIPYYNNSSSKLNFVELHTRDEEFAALIAKCVTGIDALVVLDENNDIWFT